MGFNPIKKIRKLMNRSFLARRASDRFLSKKKFRLGQQEYSYVVHSHNYTWTNERAVEISIAKNWVDTHPGQRTLEVGNVYRHYFDSSHLVIDKYERAPGVINVDVVNYSPDEKFENIFAISTLEHVGWDRDKKEPEKIITAVEKLKQLLVPGGELLLTVPVGFNYFLDDFIDQSALALDECRFLKRINKYNEWSEATWSDVKESQYNSPYPNANAIMVGQYCKS